MATQLKSRNVLIFLLAGVVTWIFFLIAFLCLTVAIMMFMESNLIGLVLLIFSIVFFIPNYFIFRFIISEVSKEKQETTVLRTQHEIIAGLDRIIQIITFLVSLGFMTAISTFIYIGMTFMQKQDWMYVVQPLPILFLIYLLFSVPSFYAVVEIGRLKHYFKDYNKIKDEIKAKMS